MTSLQTVIKSLRLKPHPEGGYFRETYRSTGESAGKIWVPNIQEKEIIQPVFIFCWQRKAFLPFTALCRMRSGISMRVLPFPFTWSPHRVNIPGWSSEAAWMKVRFHNLSSPAEHGLQHAWQTTMHIHWWGAPYHRALTLTILNWETARNYWPVFRSIVR